MNNLGTANIYSTTAKKPMSVIDDNNIKQYINSFCITTRDTWLISVTCGDSWGVLTNHRVYSRRSIDKGITWEDRVYSYYSKDKELGKTNTEMGQLCPVCIPNGIGGFIHRIYHIHILKDDDTSIRFGRLIFTYSDDDGRSWIGPEGENSFYNIDASVYPLSPLGKGWHLMAPWLYLSNGEYILPLNVSTDPKAFGDIRSEVVFIKSSNIAYEKDPLKVKFNFYPIPPNGIMVEIKDKPGETLAQEPQIVELSDNRLMCVMRTGNGCIYYTVSDDMGQTWQASTPLRYRDGGELILNPNCPCPFKKLSGGRYSLLYCNNDGTANGGESPFDARNNRYPVYISIGRETGNINGQPLVFSSPKLLCTTEGFRENAHTRDLTYGNFMEHEGEYFHFYNAGWESIQVNKTDPKLAE